MPADKPAHRPTAVFAFSLLDAAGQPDIVIDNSDAETVFWILHNNASAAGQDLVITPFPSGKVGPAQYHFMFSFQPGALTAAPALDGWDMAVEKAGATVKSLYVALSGTAPQKIAPGAELRSALVYSDAVQANPNSATVSATLTAGKNVTVGGTSIVGRAFGPIPLTLVKAERASPSTPPLSVDFVGRRSVLNDGETENSFTFALTNMTAADISLAPEPPDEAAAPTIFTVWFDAAPNASAQTYSWALARVQDLDATGVDLPPPSSDWQVRKAIQKVRTVVPGNPQWHITLTKTVVLGVQDPVLFTFSGIKTDLDPGYARMYVQYRNLPGHSDGILIAELEKTPLLYGTTRGQGAYLSAGIPAGSTPPPPPNYDSSGLLVEQFGANPAVTLRGGTGLLVQPTAEEPAATLEGGVLIKTGNQEIEGLAITADNAKAALAVTQSGNGLAAEVTGNAQVSGSLTAGSATVSGDLTVAQKATANGLLTAAAGANVAGLLATLGPVAMFGQYQARTIGTAYAGEDTDGFVVAVAEWAGTSGTNNSAGYCVYALRGFVNGAIVAKATGGNVGAFWMNSPSDWVSVSAPNANSLFFPVPKGTQWYVDYVPANYPNQNAPQVPATPFVYWVPVGATKSGADAKRAVAAAAAPGTVVAVAKKEPSPAADKFVPATENVANVLERILGRPISAEHRKELVEGLKQLM